MARFLHTILLGASMFALFGVGTARACSDSGPLNGCNDGGATWISCSVHTDCPTGQVCETTGYCLCGMCIYGESCSADGCSCAVPEPPTTPEGCEVFEERCHGRGVRYEVFCPMDAGSPGDGGGAGPMDAGSPGDGGGAGCATVPGRVTPAPWSVLAVFALVAARRRHSA